MCVRPVRGVRAETANGTVDAHTHVVYLKIYPSSRAAPIFRRYG